MHEQYYVVLNIHFSTFFNELNVIFADIKLSDAVFR